MPYANPHSRLCHHPSSRVLETPGAASFSLLNILGNKSAMFTVFPSWLRSCLSQVCKSRSYDLFFSFQSLVEFVFSASCLLFTAWSVVGNPFCPVLLSPGFISFRNLALVIRVGVWREVGCIFSGCDLLRTPWKVPEYQEAGLPPSGCLGVQPLFYAKHTFRFLPPSFPQQTPLPPPIKCVLLCVCVLVSVG